MITNIRQTATYARYMRSLNWQVDQIDGVYVFIKKLPVLPAVIKIQRPNKLPPYKKLQALMKRYATHTITVEPNFNLKLEIGNWKFFHDPYIHTKSFHVDIQPDAQTIFNRFAPSKRRAVRRAQELGVTVEISNDIEAFIHLKNRAAGMFLGFLTTYGFTRKLWRTFYPQHARVILGKLKDQVVAGILLLYANRVAYYWMAAANQAGKKHFAPTLVVWEAFKFAKIQSCTTFDFEGVYDERFPAKARDWQGFSRFKAGFGGTAVYYPQAFKLKL